ncbi:MAG: imidazolonepropionase [Proteobacteria bacterium]|nr:imidazolonepropionase [Pseudomonadota bacterium]MCP4915360.1 imidazolonepropionase [Pseudomonadota bacterium]
MKADLVVRDITELHTMDAGEGPTGRLTDAAVAFSGSEVVYVGPTAGAPSAARTLDGTGCIGLPGLVDCHTHALFAGSRADEFERRLAGVPYSEILEAGGGILSTVAATRAADDDTLHSSLHARLTGFLANGVTTVEVKTGYALSTEHERRCLDILGGDWPTRVVRTFLGAHTVPAEWRPDRAGYVAHLVEEMLPAVAEHADCIDVYCDRGAFTLADARRILEAGIALGLTGRIHAEQVEHTGSAALAAQLGCASADHLERLDAAGIAALGKSDTVGVLLPGARLYLKDPAPPARALIEAGARLAVATDFNPGSSPVRDLLSCATLACIEMGLTVDEALLGITRHAGLALARPRLGWLGSGSVADLALFRPPPGEPASAAVLVQYMGGHRAEAVVRDGALVV